MPLRPLLLLVLCCLVPMTAARAESVEPDVYQQLAQLQANRRYDSAAKLVRTHQWSEAEKQMATALLLSLREQADIANREVYRVVTSAVSMDFEGDQLVSVLQYFGGIPLPRHDSVEVEIDWQTLRDAGIEPDQPITAEAESIRVADGIDLVLQMATPEGKPVPATWRVHDGRIVIDTRAQPITDPELREAFLTLLACDWWGIMVGEGLTQTRQDKAARLIAASSDGVGLLHRLSEEADIGGQAHALRRLATLDAELACEVAKRHVGDCRQLRVHNGDRPGRSTFGKVAEWVLREAQQKAEE